MDIRFLTEEVEKVSQLYTKNFGITRDSNWFVLKLQEELGELVQSYLMMNGQAKKKGRTEEEIAQDFRKELADVFSHVLLLASHYGVDLQKEVEDKWLVWTRR
jgi:NTP pyrophosphatase (non-canonical NTP hydrolase)